MKRTLRTFQEYVTKRLRFSGELLKYIIQPDIHAAAAILAIERLAPLAGDDKVAIHNRLNTNAGAHVELVALLAVNQRCIGSLHAFHII